MKKVYGEIDYFGLSDWWLSDFTDDERRYLKKIYKPLLFKVFAGSNQAEADEGLSYLDEVVFDAHSGNVVIFLEGLLGWAGKNSEIYRKINFKLKEVISKSSIICTDFEKFDADKYYRAWFLNRFNFLFNLNESYRQNDARTHVIWDAVDDDLSTPECKKLNNRVFHKNDQIFKRLVQEHWCQIRHGCRCSVIIIYDWEIDEFLGVIAKPL